MEEKKEKGEPFSQKDRKEVEGCSLSMNGGLEMAQC